MHFVTFLTTLISFLFAIPVFSAAIFNRDNACTACLATVEAAANNTQIIDPTVCDDKKKTIMHEEVCSTLNATPLFNFCESYVEMWSPDLYHFLIDTSSDPKVVCSQPQFKAC